MVGWCVSWCCRGCGGGGGGGGGESTVLKKVDFKYNSPLVDSVWYMTSVPGVDPDHAMSYISWFASDMCYSIAHRLREIP